MINVSNYFYDLTGGNLPFTEVSINTKAGQHIICSMATLTKRDVILFCPMVLMAYGPGVRVVPYDITTAEVFLPFDSQAFQSTATLSPAWRKIWSKYAEDTCKAIPLTDLPKHNMYFEAPDLEYMVQ